jgi:hypothetical protein
MVLAVAQQFWPIETGSRALLQDRLMIASKGCDDFAFAVDK